MSIWVYEFLTINFWKWSVWLNSFHINSCFHFKKICHVTSYHFIYLWMMSEQKSQRTWTELRRNGFICVSLCFLSNYVQPCRMAIAIVQLSALRAMSSKWSVEKTIYLEASVSHLVFGKAFHLHIDLASLKSIAHIYNFNTVTTLTWETAYAIHDNKYTIWRKVKVHCTCLLNTLTLELHHPYFFGNQMQLWVSNETKKSTCACFVSPHWVVCNKMECKFAGN